MLYTSFTASGKYSHVRAASVVAVLACWTAAGAEPVVGFETGLGRVRSSNVAILTMLNEGSERSPALQALVARISRSDGLVYVEYGYCAFGHLNACVLPYLVAAQGQRYLRVLISPDSTRVSPDQRLALIAHELQHAIEILDDRDVVDVLSMQTMFRRIGIPLVRREGYETTAARAAGDKVYDELTRSSRRRRRSGGRRSAGYFAHIECVHHIAVELPTALWIGGTII